MHRKVLTFAAAAVATAAFGATGGIAGARSARAVPCAQTTIVKLRMPSGPAQYQSGMLALKNGASLRLQGSPAEMYQVRAMRVGDAVAACYGPLKNYADAPPSRAMTVLDLANGSYYGTLIGNWQAPL